MGFLLTAYAKFHPSIDLSDLEDLPDFKPCPRSEGRLLWHNGHLHVHDSRLILTVDGPFRDQIRRFQTVLADLQKVNPRVKIRSYGLSHRMEGDFRGYLINFWTPPCLVNVHYEPEISGLIYAKMDFPNSRRVRMWIAESGAIEMANIRDIKDLILGQECIKSLQALANVRKEKNGQVEVAKQVLQPRPMLENQESQ